MDEKCKTRAAARAYLQATLAAIHRIAEWPLASRLRDDVRLPVRLLPYQVRNIFYDVGAGEVSVIRVLHHSTDWINLL
jgi:plasmid stabilization system protein ParE